MGVSLKVLLGYIAVGIIKLMGLFTFRGAQRFGRFIGWTLWLRRTRSREVAKRNIAICFPEKSEQEQQAMVKQALLHGGMTAAEVAAAWGWSREKGAALLKGYEGLGIMQAAIDEDRGTLFMPLHHGNWEFLNHAMYGRANIVGMYRPAKMPPFDKFMHDSRARLKLGLVPTTKQGVQTLFDTLNKGDMAVVLPDQEPKRPHGEFADFFGRPALTPKLPYELIQKTGCNVVIGFCRRLPNSEGFVAHFLKPDDDIYSDDLKTHLTAMNQCVEQAVRICPEQFEWSYKRFKRSAEGYQNPYSGCP